MTTFRDAPQQATSTYRHGLHSDPEHVRRYDSTFRDRRRVQAILWTTEQSILGRVVGEIRPHTALDFACGTGRVLTWLSGRVDEVTGVDVSGPMVDSAASNAPHATVVVGDVTVEPDLIPGTFDVVTMFRFLLNAEPALRADALAWVARHTGPGGVLVANIHRNQSSLTGLLARARRALTRCPTPRTMSLREAGDLLESHGFEVVARYGYGYLPYGTYGASRVPCPRLVSALESRLAGAGARARVASHVLLVARRT